MRVLSIVVTLVLSLLHQADAAARGGAGVVAERRAFGKENYVLGSKAIWMRSLKRAAGASAIVVRKEGIDVNGDLRMTPSNVCPGEPVAMRETRRAESNQCSAAMITRTRAITAAHCLKGFGPSELVLASGYYDQASAKTVRVRNIRRYLYCRHDKSTDVAVVELEDKASWLAPRLSRRMAPSPGMRVHLASYPAGLSLRMSTCIGALGPCTQAVVTDIDADSTWFRAPLDAASGSSGGAVVDGRQRLIGVVHGGDQGLVEPPGECASATDIPDGCKGQWISRVDKLPAGLFDDEVSFGTASCVFGDQRQRTGCDVD